MKTKEEVAKEPKSTAYCVGLGRDAAGKYFAVAFTLDGDKVADKKMLEQGTSLHAAWDKLKVSTLKEIRRKLEGKAG